MNNRGPSNGNPFLDSTTMDVSIDYKPQSSHVVEVFRYDFKNEYTHYVLTHTQLTPEDQKQLGQLLASFPHASSDEWPDQFASIKFSDYPKELLKIAANAYDHIGNTVLGVACEYGKSTAAVQQLIDLGADLNTPDDNMNKLAMHWAIWNKLSFKDKTSFAAVNVLKCLLENKARIDITCYNNTTPFQYAKRNECKAAAILIQNHYVSGAVCALFANKIPERLGKCISQFNDTKDGSKIMRLNKTIYNSINEKLGKVDLMSKQDDTKSKRARH